MVKWVKPSWEIEYGEFERLVDEQGLSLEVLQKGFDTGYIMTLDDGIWSSMENTESYWFNGKELEWGQISEITKVLGLEYRRDWGRILWGFAHDAEIPMPILIRYRDSRYEVVGGNTRLCMAKLCGLTPDVWVIEV
jgi:hypothetical protein